MAQFRALRSAEDLPVVGALETNVLDFKATIFDQYGRPDLFELAKDVAAFANAEGDALVVGAREDGARAVLGRYEPFDAEQAKAVRVAYGNAAAQFCSPCPVVDSVSIARDHEFIVVVNVAPFAGQVVGVRAREVPDAYVFPRRVGIQTVYLRSEQLPMFMVPEVRRIAILLRGVPANEYLHLFMRMAMHTEGQRAYFLDIDEIANVLVLGSAPNCADSEKWAVPLDRIESVWKASDGWHVVYRTWR